MSLHVEPIRRTPDEVTAYAMKAIENFRFGYDDLLILPRVWSEMRPDCYRPGARGETKQTGYRQASEMVWGKNA